MAEAMPFPSKPCSLACTPRPERLCSRKRAFSQAHFAEWKSDDLGLDKRRDDRISHRSLMRIPVARFIHRLPALMALLILCAASALAQQKTSDSERQLFNSVNQERKAHGLPALKSDEALTAAARAHAQRMAEQGTISHQLPGEPPLPTRAKAAGARFSWLSENVDEGQNAAAIHQSFMKSPQHRANILDTDMDSAGIGIAERNGQLFAVEDFSKAK